MLRPVIVPYRQTLPVIDSRAEIAPTAWVIGAVRVGGGARIGAGAVLRGDVNSITLGAESFLGAGCTVHVNPGNPTEIGPGVRIGPGAILHGCRIGPGAVVLDGAEVGAGAAVRGGALVSPGMQVAAGTEVGGVPARPEGAAGEGKG